MFKLFAAKGVECVLPNACYSEVQAKAISQHVNYVIGMNKTIGDKAAIAFSVAFYDALADLLRCTFCNPYVAMVSVMEEKCASFICC